MGTDKSFLQPLGTLQLIAVVAVVFGHFWVEDPTFLMSACVGFCYVYSGFFTAMRHTFGPDYGLKEHAVFMWNKLTRLYPLHLFALVVCIVGCGYYPLSLKVLLAHLTLTSPFIPNPAYYFGYNAVAWFICALFFLYLMAPLVVRLLRRLSLIWQVALITLLLVLEFVCGYAPGIGEDSLLLNPYYLYQFPPIRLLDFATGVTLYNITQSVQWKRLAERLTMQKATLLEVAAVVVMALLYIIEEKWLYPHCYRAFCTSVLSSVAVFAPFALTSGCPGHISKLLSIKPLALLSQATGEIYLLQLGVFFMISRLCKGIGLAMPDALLFTVRLLILFAIAWLTHRYLVKPIARRWSIKTAPRQ